MEPCKWFTYNKTYKLSAKYEKSAVISSSDNYF